MTLSCGHSSSILTVTPGSKGCEACLESGGWWVDLRLCRSCGHVGCCDDSPGRHARAHFGTTGHPVIEGYDPPQGWGWCYVDDVQVDLPDQTPQLGPIPRFVWNGLLARNGGKQLISRPKVIAAVNFAQL